IIRMAGSTDIGGAADGVLGVQHDGGITLVQGWNWYTGADSTGVGANQYDFETIAMHELGHALGLGHSPDKNSVMYTTLDTGQVKRNLRVADLGLPDLD